MIEYIGIDLGGTNIRVGAIDENENIIFEYKEPTYKEVTNGEDLYIKIEKLIKKVPNYKQAKSIGLGVPGSVDIKTKRIITSKNVSILKNFPLSENLNKEFNKPIYIENDAKVAALAEALSRKAKEKNIVCYITISTGLGGGVIINKNIYHGSNNLGGYLSRMILDGENTSDSLISGTALYNIAKEKIDENIKNTEEIFKLSKTNNIANEIVSEFKKNLVVLFLNISATINPDIIILGGGVLKSKEYFLEDVINEFRNKAHPLTKNIIIETAGHKEPGILGACLLAKTEKLAEISSN